jgi:glucose-1-phosphate adenylyltransferase
VAFDEKPAEPRPIPDRPDQAFASMGNYLFDRETLVETLLEDAGRSTDHDFGRTAAGCSPTTSRRTRCPG